jgi:hypothetical protein
MRNFTITISARIDTDNYYSFSSLNNINNLSSNYPELPDFNDVSSVYQFISMNLNYSIQSSNVTSTLILSMNQPYNPTNALRSGQNIEIIENGKTIFQGTLLSCQYQIVPISGNNASGGMYLFITLAPSIYQFTVLPCVLDNIQAKQMSQSFTNPSILVNSLIVSGVVGQTVSTTDLLKYMITNSDYSAFFKREIKGEDLPTELFLMSPIGLSRDTLFRTTIDYTNTVFYQREDGLILTRLLSDSLYRAPFGINLTNQNPADGLTSVLDYTFNDNITTIPAIINNYSILPSSQSVTLQVTNNFTNYSPNPEYFPRIAKLVQTGWLNGVVSNTQLNQNIIKNPSTVAIFNKFAALKNKYLTSVVQVGAIDNALSNYQNLITAKSMAQSLTGYFNLECRISLDDPYLDQNNLQFILGTVVNILNCDMESGIIATYTRSYSNSGSFATLNICPLGSITGAWA